MLGFIVTIIKLLIILCVVATIHEFGHFIISKLFKAQVNEFAIGFGPKIWQKKFKDTMYSLRWIPLGGYCAIEGEDGESQSENSFAKKKTWQKILILLAGATMNAILAFGIFIGIAFAFPTYTTKITELMPNSVLEQAGIKPGDTIYSINGKKVKLQSDLLNQEFDEVVPVKVEYLRDGNKYETEVPNAITKIGYIGVSFKIAEDNQSVTNVIDLVSGGGAGVKAGLKAGDKIVSINGIETKNSSDVIKIIRENPDKELEATVQRDGQIQTKKIIPEAKYSMDLQILSTESVKTNLPYAFESMISNFKRICGSYIDLFRGRVSVNEMSGIVGIGEVVSKTSSFLEFLNLMGIISLAVGVANVMPFPPLDGGKIVIVLFEAITRKKVSEKTEAIISYIGFGLLILLTLFVTYNDIVRIL